MSGFCVVIAQRPTLPCGTTIASPTLTLRPIHESSACSSTPSTPKFMRNRRGSTSPRRARLRSRRVRTRRGWSPRRCAAGPLRRGRREQSHVLVEERRERVVPRPRDATCGERVLVEVRDDLVAALDGAGNLAAVGEAKRERRRRPRHRLRGRAAAGRAGPCCSRAGRARRRGRRRGRRAGRARAGRISSTCSSARPFTGVSEIHEMRGTLTNLAVPRYGPRPRITAAPARRRGRAQRRARRRARGRSRARRRTSRRRRTVSSIGPSMDAASKRSPFARPPLEPSVWTTRARVERAVVARARS